MKLYFLITIFLVIITSRSSALNCIDADDSITMYSGDFTLPGAQEVINDTLTVNNAYGECLVKIDINYLYRYIDIYFDTASQSYDLKSNQEVRVETLIRTSKDKTTFDQAEIQNTVEFKCDYVDECDRHFILDNLEWLLKADYDQLVSAISLLLISEDQYTGLCFNYTQNNEEVCSDGMCFVRYSIKDDKSSGGCNGTRNEPTELHLNSFIVTNKSIYQDDQIEYQIADKIFYIDYWCRVNHCNNQITKNLIINAVKDHYDMSPVYKALKVKVEEDLEEEHTTTSERETTATSEGETTTTSARNTTTSSSTNTIITTTSNTNTTKQSNNIATSLEISLIMIIFNACLILPF